MGTCTRVRSPIPQSRCATDKLQALNKYMRTYEKTVQKSLTRLEVTARSKCNAWNTFADTTIDGHQDLLGISRVSQHPPVQYKTTNRSGVHQNVAKDALTTSERYEEYFVLHDRLPCKSVAEELRRQDREDGQGRLKRIIVVQVVHCDNL